MGSPRSQMMGQQQDPRMAKMNQMQNINQGIQSVKPPTQTEDAELIQLIKLLTSMGIPMEQLRGRTKEELVELVVSVKGKMEGGRDVKETAEVMLDFATRLWPDDSPPPLISSFSHVSLETAMDMIDTWPRGLLLDEYLPNWKELAGHINTSTININGNKATLALINEYLDFRKPILAYTINNPAKAKELISWGVSSVFSDCPDVIRDEIESIH